MIDYIARKTTNTRKDIVNALERDRIEKIYNLADVYHSDNIETVSDYFIDEPGITKESFDNVKACRYVLPSYWDI